MSFKKLGIELTTQDGKLRDVADVFDDLTAATKDLDEDEVLTVMNAIFGKISIASATNLLGEGADKIRELEKAFKAAGGSSQKTAEFIRDDVKGSIDALNSAIEGVGISIFSLNEGPLKKAIDRMTDWIRANEEVIASGIGEFFLSIINNMDSIVKWTKRIVIGFGSLMAINLVLSTLTGAFTLFNLVVAANPIFLIGAAIALIVIGVGLLVDALHEATDGFTDMSKAIPSNRFTRALGIAPETEGAGMLSKDLANVNQLSAAPTFEGLTGLPKPAFDPFAAGLGPLPLAPLSAANDAQGPTGPEAALVQSPGERTARSIEESTSVNKQEVTIKTADDLRADVTGGKLGNGLTLQESGAFK